MKPLGRPPLRQRRRRAMRRALLAVALLIAAGAAAVAYYGREIATQALHVALARAGVPPDRVEIRRLGFTEIELGPLQLGGADGPALSGVTVGWSVPSLLTRRLTFLRVEGLRVRAQLGEDGVSIAGLPRGDGTGTSTPVLPIDRLEIADAKLDVSAQAFVASAALNATLTGSAQDIRGEALLEAEMTGIGPSPLRLIMHLPQFELRRGDSGLNASVREASVALPDYAARIAAIEARASAGQPRSVHMTAELHDQAPSRRVAPLLVALGGTGDGDALNLSGTINDRDKALEIKLTGRHDLARKQGTLQFESAPLRFAADGRQPADLVPLIGPLVQRATGTLWVRGEVGWGAEFTSKAEIALQDAGFETAISKLSDLDAKISLTSLLPPRTAGAQHVRAKVQVAGLPEGAVDLRFALPGDNRLRLENASFALAGGSLEIANLTLAPGQPVRSELAIRSLDLATLLGLIDVDGLSGTGTIDGRIPVRVDDSGVAILAGRLGSKGPGTVRYTGGALPDTGSTADDQIKLVRQALSDFRYTEMTLNLDRGTGGDGSLLINLKGSNPAVLQNNPFVFNIKLETNFDKLAAILLSGYAAAEGLMRGAVTP